MTTNVNMIRKMGDFEVTQRTKDGMFNATALLKQWNEFVKTQRSLKPHNSGELENDAENQEVLNRGISPYLKNSSENQLFAQKELNDFFYNNTTKDFIKTIMQKENLTDVKEVYRAHKGKYGGTWMHPMLFIDFAMWLNPSFKYDVLKFVYDEMIKYRNFAGDTYKELASSIGRVVPKSLMITAMKNVAQALNYIVFNEHKHGVRNDYGTEDKQHELYELQRKVAALIEEGFIKSFEQLMNYLRETYKRKHLQKVFVS
ncbi:KilA-N domain-containing protein [Capnocytophaga haemolytica]|uniref:KilA-N domain n=2 Tax=Capnocytophaga haemolytica TaxID=45243 RepID=A0AAX2GVN5_9FLAO|nr:KilA-N domain-containing protein [Capnocytophaga haemolytica]SFN68276.1 KilA-N domain-containing protein [Capnocytophaga haemolytica]SNV05044.1 KilA-N domain [Capnocytophaga haemolytica]